MSVEESIADIVVRVLESARDCKPTFMDRKRLGEELGVKESLISEWIRKGILVEEVHFTRYTPTGRPRFYWPEIKRLFKPRRSDI